MALPLGNTIRSSVLLKLGSIVAVDVNVYGAISEDKDAKTSMCCVGTDKKAHDAAKPNQLYRCPVCQREGTIAAFGRAKATGGGGLIPLRPEDLDAAAAADAEFKAEMELSAHLVDEVGSQLQPAGKSYYLTTSKQGASKVYTVLVDAITSRPDLMFVTRWAMKGAASVFQLRVSEGVLVLQLMADPKLLRQRPEIVRAEISAKEAAVADTLVDLLVEPFNADTYHRTRGDLIADLTDGREPVMPNVENPAAGGFEDLTDMLTTAIDRVSAKRGVSPAKRVAKKSAAKRPAARKAS